MSEWRRFERSSRCGDPTLRDHPCDVYPVSGKPGLCAIWADRYGWPEELVENAEQAFSSCTR